MKRAELKTLLEPLIVSCVNRGVKPGSDVAQIAARWMRESGLDMENAMNEYNLVVAEIVKENNLQRN